MHYEQVISGHQILMFCYLDLCCIDLKNLSNGLCVKLGSPVTLINMPKIIKMVCSHELIKKHYIKNNLV